MKNKKICILGLGYIGLPTAALLANNGYIVHGVDILEDTVDIINKGEIHIVEPNLDSYVKKAVLDGKLTANLKPCIADIFIIAVPTPLKDNNVADISYILIAIKSIIPFIRDDAIIILESTSPVGTTKELEKVLIESNINTNNISIAYCPERVLPGKIMQELIHNDRIVGGINNISSIKVKKFYETFVEGNIYTTNSQTAELAKLSENAFRDNNIAFANELSIICDKLDINVWELITLTNKHPRVNILNPGIGVGGHCIAVDPWFIINSAEDESILMKTSREVNLFKTQWIIEKIKNKILSFTLEKNKKPNVACLGLSYKPNIDDLRESPALDIVNSLIKSGYDIKVVEPNIDNYKDIELVNIKEALTLDIVIILVAHDEFKKINNSDNIIDFCGIFKSNQL
jgi:UDP-N-acetyl-D-mannosaminuronic acid dehydrogenase